MDRQPLIDQFPYHFYPPRLSRFWWRVSRPYNFRQILRREQRVSSIEVQGIETLRALLNRGDGVLITPNHPDSADPGTLFEVSHRVGQPFTYLAGFQLFYGFRRFLLPRIGVFPIDREGTDLRAFKAGVEILTKAVSPLVIFPEGEVYHTSDRLTPIREGAVAFASTAAKRLAEHGKTAWIVPTAIKYRFVETCNPLPALIDVMNQLEARFTWWPRSDLSIVNRIYRYAEGLLGLKELEILGWTRSGPIKERIVSLRDSILDRIEDQRVGKRRNDSVPVRIKELRRVCLESLSATGITPDQTHSIRRDLNDIFVALQLFSYPGDYVREDPTLERIAETLFKFEQDTLGHKAAMPHGERRAIVRFGEPIDVGQRLAELGKPRVANVAMTAELESKIQVLLDDIGPGRTIDDELSSPSSVDTKVNLAAGS
jgi:1-acyl-sn-glycerol-3-phosphate acyltransferase